MYQKPLNWIESLLCWFRRNEVSLREHRKDNRLAFRHSEASATDRIDRLRKAAQPILDVRAMASAAPRLAESKPVPSQKSSNPRRPNLARPSSDFTVESLRMK